MSSKKRSYTLDVCSECGKKVDIKTGFRDEYDLKIFQEFGLCQKCIDERCVFTEEDHARERKLQDTIENEERKEIEDLKARMKVKMEGFL